MQVQFSWFRQNRFHFRETWRLSLPVMVGQLGNILMGFIDNLMIGELGYVPLSAAALANGLSFILIVIGIGVSSALSPLVAEASTGAPQKVGAYFRSGTWVGIAVGIILGLLTYMSAGLLYNMNQPIEDVVLAVPYQRILSYSVLPLMVFLMFKQFADGLSFTRPAMYITLIGLLINVFSNWLLIYGNWGFPRLELDGAGYGTLGSRVCMMLLMILYVRYANRFQRFRLWQNWEKIEWRFIRKILQIGIPSGAQYFFEVGAFGGASIMIGWMADASAARAAHQIALQLSAISYMMVTGLAAGASIRVAQYLGERNAPRLRQAGLTGLLMGAGFMLVSAAIFILLRYPLADMFVDDEQVVALGAQMLIFAAFFQLSDGIQAVGAGILRGLQDVKIPTLITFIAYWGISLPMGYGMGVLGSFGVSGIWYGFNAGLGFAAIMLAGRFLWLSRKPLSE